MVKKFRRYLYSFWRNSRTWQTDGRTDRQTPHADIGRAYASHRAAKTFIKYTMLTWSDENDMVVNFNKTKEMVMCPPSLTSNFPLINTPILAILNELIRLNYWVSIWTLILPGTHTHTHTHMRVCVTHGQRVVDHNPNMSQCAHVWHHAFQVNPAIILSKTTIACRRSPNTVTTLLFRA